MILVLLPLILDFSNKLIVEEELEIHQDSSLDTSILSLLGNSMSNSSKEALGSINDITVHDKQVTFSIDVVDEEEQPIMNIVQERKDRLMINLSGVRLTESLALDLVDGQALLETEDPFVSHAHLSIDENNKFQIQLVLDFNGPTSYALLSHNENNDIRVQLIPETFRIVMDPGHGGKDPGAIGVSGRYEKKFTLEMANKVKDRLMDELHFVAMLTREDDRFVSLQERAEVAEEWDADVFISVHGNTFEQRISGTESYYYHPGSLEIAQHMHEFLLEGTELPDREVRRREYRVLKYLDRVPGVLLEIGYLSNRAEEELMWSDDFQNRVADSIVKGLKNYFVIGGD